MSNLAVVVPTKSRPQNVDPILQAWWVTGGFDAADLWFVYDYDDPQRRAYQGKFAGRAEVRVISIPEWKPLVPKLNDAALSLVRNHGYKHVAFMGDDHLPRSQRWAHMLVERHETAKRPSIVYGPDGFQNENLPTWWSMDGRIVDALNGMVPAPVQHLFCDNAVKALGERAGCLIYDERIEVEHMHPFAQKGRFDNQYQRVNRPEQYDRDGRAFDAWMRDGWQRDATLVQSLGG